MPELRHEKLQEGVLAERVVLLGCLSLRRFILGTVVLHTVDRDGIQIRSVHTFLLSSLS